MMGVTCSFHEWMGDNGPYGVSCAFLQVEMNVDVKCNLLPVILIPCKAVMMRTEGATCTILIRTV
jgi:hypothetical protein